MHSTVKEVDGHRIAVTRYEDTFAESVQVKITRIADGRCVGVVHSYWTRLKEDIPYSVYAIASAILVEATKYGKVGENMATACRFCDGACNGQPWLECCCSIRCALEVGAIYECPTCQNHGVMEVSPDPERSEVIPCVHGCSEEDAWVKEAKAFRIARISSRELPFPDSDIPF